MTSADLPDGSPREPERRTPTGAAALVTAVRVLHVSLTTMSYIVGWVFLALGVYAAVESPRLGLYVSGQGPGPGFFPFGVSLLLVAMSATWLIQIVRGRVQPGPLFADRSGRTRVQIVLVSLALFIALLTTLGYMIATLLFMLAIFRLLGHLKWRTALLLAVCGGVVLEYGFVDLLAVPLPTSTIPLIANIGI